MTFSSALAHSRPDTRGNFAIRLQCPESESRGLQFPVGLAAHLLQAPRHTLRLHLEYFARLRLANALDLHTPASSVLLPQSSHPHRGITILAALIAWLYSPFSRFTFNKV